MEPTWQLALGDSCDNIDVNILTSKEVYKEQNEDCHTTSFLVRMNDWFVHESIVEFFYGW